MRTSRDLRNILFDEIKNVRNKKSETKSAMTICNLAKQIISTVRLEMDYSKLIKSKRMKSNDKTILFQK